MTAEPHRSPRKTFGQFWRQTYRQTRLASDRALLAALERQIEAEDQVVADMRAHIAHAFGRPR